MFFTIVVEELVDKIAMSENHTTATVAVQLQLVQGISKQD